MSGQTTIDKTQWALFSSEYYIKFYNGESDVDYQNRTKEYIESYAVMPLGMRPILLKMSRMFSDVVAFFLQNTSLSLSLPCQVNNNDHC